MSDFHNMGPDRQWKSLISDDVRFFDVTSMHSLAELFGISELLMTHRPKRIVEYGAAWGGLTKLFGRWAYVHGAQVLGIEDHTYTQNKDFAKSFELLDGLPVEYLEMNEYDQKCYEKVQEFAKDQRTFYYCDGGNKPLEMRICAKILKSEDLLVCHDHYPTREEVVSNIVLPALMAEVGIILPHHVDRAIEEFGLERVYEGVLKGECSNGRATRLLALRKKPTEK